MKTVHSSVHRRRAALTELSGGRFVPPFERPERVDRILAELKKRPLGEIMAPVEHGLAPVLRIHREDYVTFLRECWAQWTAAGYDGEATANIWPSRAMTLARPPREIGGRIGYYALAAETSISEGTWEAARASANVALTGQALIQGGEPAAFSLCRPPGHHASADMFGGYCFLNNAAIAAQAFVDAGAARVAVFDVDVHHGNGTQSIFYARDDVLTLSIHGDPEETFPYFLGAADETGVGAGEGFNANYPLPAQTQYAAWREAFAAAIDRLQHFAPDALIVSLGVDTFEKDPISPFRLTSDDFLDYGDRLGQLGYPTLFVMEGGYALEEIGLNTVNVLEAFRGRHRLRA